MVEVWFTLGRPLSAGTYGGLRSGLHGIRRSFESHSSLFRELIQLPQSQVAQTALAPLPFVGNAKSIVFAEKRDLLII